MPTIDLIEILSAAPVVMAQGGIAIKLTLDFVKEMIAEDKRKFIPLLALLMGILWALVFFEAPMVEVIFWGIVTGFGAVGTNEGIEKLKAILGKKKDNALGIEGGGFDRPDPRDILYGAVENLDGEIELPESFHIGFGDEVQNQALANDPSTKMACGSYMIAHAVNPLRAVRDKIKGSKLWADFVAFFSPIYAERRSDPVINGSALQDQLWFAREKGLIKGWVKLTSWNQVRKNLYKGRPVVTGSDNINRSKTRQSTDKIAVIEDDQSGHFFTAQGWTSDDLNILKNSYGEQAYDKGFFYMKDDQFFALYSVYALVLEDDTIQTWLQIRNKEVASATKKIEQGKSLSLSEEFTLRNWGMGHLIPKD